jgi:integrase
MENPALELRSPKFDLSPTMPFTQQEVLKTLAAVDSFIESSARNGIENARRIRALVLLLRYTGMRICDVVGLSTDRISNNRVFLYTQKTGVPVQTQLPEFVVQCLQSTPQKTEKFWFWSGVGKLDSAVRSWQARLKKLFQIAGVPSGHAHRFRDTFGVELLLAGVPIERVSILLGHRSVRITEKHYNPWVRSRQEQLEADIERALAHDPVALIESKGTQKVRGENEVLN